jgi:hypothetical protein
MRLCCHPYEVFIFLPALPEIRVWLLAGIALASITLVEQPGSSRESLTLTRFDSPIKMLDLNISL